MDDDHWADPYTLLGQLQRGRGIGVREALLTDGADALVVRCIERDSRWDRQLEERGVYMARLVTALAIPIDAIGVNVTKPGFPCHMWFDTLVELAGGGSEAAARVLLRYVRDAAPEDDVAHLLARLWADGGAACRDGLETVALSRLDDDALRRVVRNDEPWTARRGIPRVAAAFEQRRTRRVAAIRSPRAKRSATADLDDRTLLGMAHEPLHSDERAAAFRELGRRGNTALLDIAELPELRNSSGFVTYLAPVVLGFGGNALPRARAWLGSGDEYLVRLGETVIAEHGEVQDGPALLGAFEVAVADDDWLHTEPIARGLGRVGYEASIRSIVDAWAVTKHSHARAAYLEALAGLRASGLGLLRDEALDDCESEVRDLARVDRAR